MRSWWDEGVDLRVSMGPVTGLSGVAEELIRHFEINPSEHDGLITEVEFAIGEQLLDTMRDILAARGIPIPAESELAPVATGS